MTMQLTYFTVRGRVEPVRLMLEATGHPYTFNGIEFGIEEWKAQKNDTPTPFGALPYIEIVNEDGTSAIFSQSLAIARHVSRITKLDGSEQGLLAQLRVDEICEMAQELLIEIGTHFWDPAANEEEKRNEVRGKIETKLKKLEAFFQKISTKPGHWIGESLTAADIYVAFFLEQLPKTFDGLFTEEAYPGLWNLYQSVFATPGIKAYVESDRRPVTYTVKIAPFAGQAEQCVQWK